MVEDAVKTGTPLDMRLLPRTQFDFHIYKNFQNNEIITYDEIATNFYVYTEKDYTWDWCVEDEKLEIMDYTCQKATINYFGREFITWFTTEIPISDGPYKFKGLPGLIVKIYDTKNHYDFTLTSFFKIETTQYITLPEEEGRIEVTRQEFRKIQKYTAENLREIVQNLGFQVSEGQMELSMEKAKKQNNPIELK
jgi:GLPGLI family protein